LQAAEPMRLDALSELSKSHARSNVVRGTARMQLASIVHA
jgi:hypothetical protein